MLSIFAFGASLVIGIVMGILGGIFSTRYGFYVASAAWVGWVGLILQLAVYGMYIFLAVTAILGINKNQDKPLMFIGGMAFYK